MTTGVTVVVNDDAADPSDEGVPERRWASSCSLHHLITRFTCSTVTPDSARVEQLTAERQKPSARCRLSTTRTRTREGRGGEDGAGRRIAERYEASSRGLAGDQSGPARRVGRAATGAGAVSRWGCSAVGINGRASIPVDRDRAAAAVQHQMQHVGQPGLARAGLPGDEHHHRPVLRRRVAASPRRTTRIGPGAIIGC
ncbi:hypothetical protein GCM10009837_68620 [Streptomyces durmitorensis]